MNSLALMHVVTWIENAEYTDVRPRDWAARCSGSDAHRSWLVRSANVTSVALTVVGEEALHVDESAKRLSADS